MKRYKKSIRESSQKDSGLSLHDLHLDASVTVTLVSGFFSQVAGAFKAHSKYTCRPVVVIVLSK